MPILDERSVPPFRRKRGGRPTRGRLRSHVDRALRLLVCVGMVQLGPIGTPPAQAQGTAAAYAEAHEALDAFMDRVAELRRSLDRRWLDVDALALELAFEDAEAIEGWVRRHVGFEPYHGVLRGATGTLASQAGNTLDQAVLLARLLGDAGYDARIARAALAPEEVAILVDAALAPKPARPFPGDRDRIAGVLDELAQTAGGAAPEIVGELIRSLAEPVLADAALLEIAEAETRELLDVLAANDVPVREDVSPFADGETVEAIRDYFFVEYRLGEADPWSAAHPALPEGVPSFAGLAVQERYEGEVPSELVHTVTFEVLQEQRLGDALTTSPLFEAWTRPTANLVGVAVGYANTPLGSDAFWREPSPALFAEADSFAPVFMDASPVGAKVFDLDGNLLDPEAAASPAAGVFENVGNAFEGAASQLASPGGDDDVRALTAQWLRFTFSAPDGSTTVVRRAVFDRLGEVARASGDVSGLGTLDRADAVRQLTTRHTWMVSVGELAPAFVLDRWLARLEASRPSLEALLAVNYGQDVDLVPEDFEGASMAWTGLPDVFATFDARRRADERVPYRAAPSLVMHAADLPILPGARTMLDVVANARVSAAPAASPADKVFRGVWETVTETTFLPPATVPVNAVRVLQAARSQGIPLRVASHPDEVDRLDPRTASVEAVRNDLESGYVVVAPETWPDGVDVPAWFRVRVADGETLGRIGDGRGGAVAVAPSLAGTIGTSSFGPLDVRAQATEYSILTRVVAGAILVLIGTTTCMVAVDLAGRDAANNSFTCLGIATGAVMIPFSAGLGFLLAAAIGIVDIAVDFEPPGEDPCPPNSICAPPGG